MAMERVEALLLKVTQSLDRAGLPYAVVGGNAVAAWVATKDPDAVRATKDVDMLLRRDSLPLATQAMTDVGFLRAEVLGVTMFVDRDDPSPKRGVHIVIANERIRAHYEHPAPDVTGAVRSDSGYLVIDLPSLVAMKLQSYRPIDQAHILDLHSVQLIDQVVMDSLPSDLRARLDEVLQKAEPQP